MFIQTYYFHEIGFETIERFKWNLRARLNLNAPMYRQYWDSYLRTKNIDFAVNKDYMESITRELESQNENMSQNNTTSVAKDEGVNSYNDKNTASSLSDGVSRASLADDYVTSVSAGVSQTKTEDLHRAEDQSSSNSKDSGKQSETTTLTAKGNIGTTSSAQLIKEWRQIMLNLDRQLIEDCADLFMQIY